MNPHIVSVPPRARLAMVVEEPTTDEDQLVRRSNHNSKKKRTPARSSALFRAYDVFFGCGVILGAVCLMLVVVWSLPLVAILIYIAGNVCCELGIRWMGQRTQQDAPTTRSS